MRRIKILIPALALAGLVGVSIAAQQPASSPAPSTPQSTSAQPTAPSAQPQNGATAAAVPVPSTAGAPEASNEQLRPVTGELEKKIDTKNAKAGDPVIVKTTERATTADGIVIPKGSRIVGHVTEVEAHSKTNPNARLTIQFDQAEIKGGQTLPIRTVLENVAPPPTTVHPTDTLNSPGMGSSPMASPSAAGAPGGATASPAGAAPGSGAQTNPPTGGGTPTMSAGAEPAGDECAAEERHGGVAAGQRSHQDHSGAGRAARHQRQWTAVFQCCRRASGRKTEYPPGWRHGDCVGGDGYAAKARSAVKRKSVPRQAQTARRGSAAATRRERWPFVS